MEKNNSIWSRIKEVSPGCVQLKCVCHSLALIMEHAFTCIPSTIGFLLTEIPAHFSMSSLKRDEFMQLFFTMNPDHQGFPTPLEKFCKTRWLVRGKILYNILVNWEELLAYFQLIMDTAPPGQRMKIRQIYQTLKVIRIVVYNNCIIAFIIHLLKSKQKYKCFSTFSGSEKLLVCYIPGSYCPGI